ASRPVSATPRKVLITQKFSSLGGGQKSLVYHLELLDRKRFEPHVMVSNTGWLTQELDRLHIPWSLAKFGHWGNIFSLPRNLMLVAQIKRYIRTHGIQLVHANEHWVGPPSYWAAKQCGIPAICHFRTGLDDLTPGRIRKYLYGRFDRVLAVAEVLKAQLSQHVEHPERVTVVRDGVEPFPDEPRYYPQRRSRIVINVGAIYHVKGQAIILEQAIPWLKADRKHFILFVGGTRQDAEYFEQMRQRVAAEGLQKQVRFLGPREDVSRLLRAADVLVAYSTVEGVPRVVMEAMFAGRPVIVSDTPGMAEVVVDGEVGRILNFNDKANLLSQCLGDLDVQYSLWESLGRRARERALSRYSTQAMCAAIQDIYDDLLK
ncbi:MAG: glycosyltransferase, partial [Verrucomicrobia bacterium]|nr:glycosyltransferase [Verrucomicrobiota bacterium]